MTQQKMPFLSLSLTFSRDSQLPLCYNIKSMKRFSLFLFTLIFFIFLFSYCGHPSQPQSYSFRSVSVSVRDQNIVKDFLRTEMERSKLCLNEDYNVLLIEKWNDEEPVIIVWLGAINEENISILEKASGKKTENIEKYDPLSKTKVKGTHYEIDVFVSVFVFQKEFTYYAKVQESFISRAAVEKLSGIFFNSIKYTSGAVGAYEEWRPGIN